MSKLTQLQPIESSEISNERLVKVMDSINMVSSKLVLELETISPNDPFGVKKHKYLINISSQADNIGQELDLSKEEVELLRIILRSHDIGKHQESLDKLDTLRPGVRHGVISVELLKENNCLDGLSEEQKIVIYDTVKYHSEKTVDLDPQSIAYKLCYILRDFDKKEIIDNSKFLSSEGVYTELNKHYFGSKLDNEYLEIISKLINDPETQVNESDEIELKLKQLLSKGINPKTFEEFIKKESTTIQDITYSYATYMLNTISFIFDISSTDILMSVLNSPMFKKRLDFIQKRITNEEYEQIISSIREFVNNKYQNNIDIKIKVELILN